MKAVLRAGGSCVRTRLRGGRDAHWAAGARPSAPFCTAKEDGAVPIREHRAGEAGGDGAQRSGHADGATTGHSTNTDARAARRSGRGDSQDALPVASPQRSSIRRRRLSRRNLRGCHRGDVARRDDGPRDRSRASGSCTGLERKPWPSKFTGLGFKAQALFLSTSERHVGDDGKRGREAAAAAAATHRAPVVS